MTTTELQLPSLTSLPNAFAISLDNYSAISLSGEDQSKYLQGQVTCDVDKLSEAKLLTGAHCNAKGKVFSVFRLFNYQNNHLLFQPKSTLTASHAELKKFGVFAKVAITTTDHLSYYIIAGKEAAGIIQQYFEQIPDSLNPIVTKGDAQVVYLAGQMEHFLFIAPTVSAAKLINTSSLPIYQSQVWQLLEIAEGFPALTEQAIDQYVPQMFNLQAIHGISFTKGCYLGQETVARMKYLGKNKRAMYHLTGSASVEIEAGNIIEMQLGDNWRKAGDIITSYKDDNGTVAIQAILSSDIAKDTVLRIKHDGQSQLTIASLPYTVTE
ncbi:MAG: tRNA-modifying protein YgfZ [Thalassotalea sp.]